MSIDKLDYSTDVIEALQGAYRQDWCLTNWTGTGKPLLPAGMIISILGYPYLVSGGDETPADPASDGAVYLKITPDAPAGATATAAYVNTFSGTWSEAYNGFYDGDSLFLNVFMTKATTNYSGKGFWLNWRERKLAIVGGAIKPDSSEIVDITVIEGGASQVIPPGFYSYVKIAGNDYPAFVGVVQIYDGSTWVTTNSTGFYSDGTNFRITGVRLSGVASSKTSTLTFRRIT